MTPGERRSATALAGIYALRMLGLFLIYPVFALYAKDLEHVTPLLVGVALGVYGLTQAVLQIPFGMLSDRWGRKAVVTLGLVLFAAGSLVAAVADSIWLVIVGRALQGAGALAAALMALLADLTREEHRTKAMAVVGMSIGLAFAAGMVLGPVLGHWIGVPGIFALTAVLALLGIAVLHLAVPTPAAQRFHRDTEAIPAQLWEAASDGQLARLYAGIFLLHLILTASFVAIPLALRDAAGLAAAEHWMVYLPIIAAAALGMLPLIMAAERRRRMRGVLVLCIAMLGLAEVGLAVRHQDLTPVVAFVFVFFVAFFVLEALLPSLVSKVAPAQSKGTALGVYSSSQFFGAFLGGTLGGWLQGKLGLAGVFGFAGVAAAVWLGLAATMRHPRHLTSYLLHVGRVTDSDAKRLAMRLTTVQGVAEAVVIPEDEVAYLKVDSRALDEAALREHATA